MSNPTETMALLALAGRGEEPAVIEEIPGLGVTYVGYCLPTTTGPDDPTWRIRRLRSREGTISLHDPDSHTIDHQTTYAVKVQEIAYPGGSPRHNRKWSERRELDYKPCEGWTAGSL